MQEFVLIALVGIDAFLITLSQIALWQRKEYRLDRMMAYLSSPEGSIKKQLFVLLAGIFLLFAYVSFFAGAINNIELFAGASLLCIFAGHAVRIVHKGLFRPDFTMRALAVFLVTVFLALAWLPARELLALHFASVIFFFPLLVASAVGVVSIPSELKKQHVISRARSYRNHLKNLAVVGITGSVGKTSTKTYLIHLLGGESEEILATSEHRNSPYSVAQDMLSRLSQKTTTYIAEMGAYVRGEIAELASLTKPKIGIITAITNQHAALFGSLEALARTKWELVQSLPENGIAILNKDDAQIALQARNLKKEIVWFSATTHADVAASDIVLAIDHTSCVVSIRNTKHRITLPIISRGQMVPMLAAVSAAHVLGVSSKNIFERIGTLPSLPRTMELRTGAAGARVIDDSYSASEASFANAIEYLKAISAKDTRLILVPIIELGSEGSAVHERIGMLLKDLSAHVYMYGDEYAENITRGLGKNPKAKIIWFHDAKKMKDHILKGITKQTLLLLEGRVPSIVRDALL